MSRTAAQRGFTLLEIVLVMAIIALASVLAAAAMTGGFKGMQLKASAKEIASNLRYTRTQAIATGKPQRFVIEPAKHAWQAPNAHHGTIPDKLGIEFTGAREARANAARQDQGAIEFFPDGAGRATLYAQSLLDQAGVGEPLEAGTRSGTFENERYRWTLAVRPYVDPAKGTVATTADGAQLFQLDLHIDWGPAAAQKLQLQTLRLSRSDTVPQVP